jgi:UDPglucose 6-dehydrogenase
VKIGIIGSGHVGLVTGACFASLGNEVVCVDNDTKKISLLKRGKSPIYEPGLEEMIRSNVREGRLSFSTQIAAAVRRSEVLFVSVGTPPKEGGEADLTSVEDVALEIARAMTSYRLIVEKSTVPVETGEWIRRTIEQNRRRNVDFDVASNPEFLREGSAVQDFLSPDRVVLGVASKRAEKTLRELYAPLKAPMVVTDLKSAEILKHASNSFLASKISFINLIARVCEAVGADVEKVAEGMGLDRRIGASFLKAGIGFGGFCFPKDLQAFIRITERLGVDPGLLREALEINETQKKFFVDKVIKNLWNLKGKVLGVLGLSFKPDTDDMRFAPSVEVVQALLKEKATLKLYDPQAMPEARKLIKGASFVQSAYEAARGADALLVLTEWSEFQELDFQRIKKLLRHATIFDGRNLYDPARMKSLGFRYYGVGR